MEQKQRMEKKWMVWWVEKIKDTGRIPLGRTGRKSPLRPTCHTPTSLTHREGISHFSHFLCLLLHFYYNIYFFFSICIVIFFHFSSWKHGTHLYKSFWVLLNSISLFLKCCCSITYDFMHNLSLDFSVIMRVSTLFLHGHLHNVYCSALCWVWPHACAHFLYTEAHTHICKQAHRAIGSCWELPVYLINSTWLEAKDMQTRKRKINNTKIKYFPAQPPLEKIVSVWLEMQRRGKEKKVSHWKVSCLKHWSH